VMYRMRMSETLVMIIRIFDDLPFFFQCEQRLSSILQTHELHYHISVTLVRLIETSKVANIWSSLV
jgi:hypothetical protein